MSVLLESSRRRIRAINDRGPRTLKIPADPRDDLRAKNLEAALKIKEIAAEYTCNTSTV